MKLGFAAVICGSLSGGGHAADLAGGEPPVYEPIENVSPWTFELGGYGFIPISIDGTSTVDGGAVDLDLGPDEIFDLLQFAVSGRGEAWRRRDVNDGSAFGFVFDAQYVNLGLSNQGIGPASAGTVKADIRQGIIDAAVGYRFASLSTGSSPHQRLEFDVTAGARYNYIRQKIQVIPGLPAPFTQNLGGDRHWVSPLVGARANFVFNDRWNMVVRGDMSGFGVSGEDLSWSLSGIAGYKFTEKATFRFGYRVYDIDYSEGQGANEFGYDITQHGPFLGLSYRF
ncbi:outer membrane protein [Labrenzia sp. PHM005]|uniref:outer membrane protein n=1 Tax=Labrenzia sp. PHM005 TaxID=2590016 RepID=UPI00143DE690|nr:outer membrane beta-barrel protein [Labrenzia sp. PHM005]